MCPEHQPIPFLNCGLFTLTTRVCLYPRGLRAGWAVGREMRPRDHLAEQNNLDNGPIKGGGPGFFPGPVGSWLWQLHLSRQPCDLSLLQNLQDSVAPNRELWRQSGDMLTPVWGTGTKGGPEEKSWPMETRGSLSNPWYPEPHPTQRTTK